MDQGNKSELRHEACSMNVALEDTESVAFGKELSSS